MEPKEEKNPEAANDSGSDGAGLEPAVAKKLKAAGQKSRWIDPSEAETVVDLSQTARLRKLRDEKTQTKIDGTSFQHKLRSYYQSNKFQKKFLSWVGNTQALKLVES